MLKKKDINLGDRKSTSFNPFPANVWMNLYQRHGHQKEALHRYFRTDFYNQGIVGKVLFFSKQACPFFEIGSEMTM